MSAAVKTELRATRDSLIATAASGELPLERLRAAMTDLYEHLLLRLSAAAGITPTAPMALLAFGGLGRREMLPFSDLDIVLLHDGSTKNTTVSAVAEELLYPLWDAGIALDHSVRTPHECRTLMRTEPKVALSMLESRCIAGNTALAGSALAGMRQAWIRTAPGVLDQLVAETASRRATAGAIAHRAEPDVKNGTGGLRDAHILQALAAAQLSDAAAAIPNADGASVAQCRTMLLDARTALHVVARRRRDILHAQYADDVAALLGMADRFSLAQHLSHASRTIAFATDLAIRTATNARPRRGMAAIRRAPARTPLAEGVVAHNGEVALARSVRPDRDSGLLLRIAAAAATSGLPIGIGAMRRLVATAPLVTADSDPLAVDMLTTLLGTGEAMVEVIETLDRSGLWSRVLPEWDAVRDLPSRAASHIYTVDRHLVQVSAEAARLATGTSRPDLLLLGALIHDLGKGRTTDHSILGAELAAVIAKRLGLDARDQRRVVLMVRHHLLLASTITRCDPRDPDTASAVLDTLAGDMELLNLLMLLTEADSRGTGPGVWTAWKAEMLTTLHATCAARGHTGTVDDAPPDTAAVARAVTVSGLDPSRAAAQLHLQRVPQPGRYTLTAVLGTTGHGAGTLARLCATLGARAVTIHSLDAVTAPGNANNLLVRAVIATQYGEAPAAELLLADLTRNAVRAPRAGWSMGGQGRGRHQEPGPQHSDTERDAMAPQGSTDTEPRIAAPLVWVACVPREGESAQQPRAGGEVRVHVRALHHHVLRGDVLRALAGAGWQVAGAVARTRAGFAIDTYTASIPPGAGDGKAAAQHLAAALRAALPAATGQVATVLGEHAR